MKILPAQAIGKPPGSPVDWVFHTKQSNKDTFDACDPNDASGQTKAR